MQADLPAVQQSQLFLCGCQAHNNIIADGVQIKSVHGLAKLQHHIVTNIDDDINTAYAAAAQPFTQPYGRGGAGIDMANNSPTVARALAPGFDFNAALIVNIVLHRLDSGRINRLLVKG